jgi:hypothetical protein
MADGSTLMVIKVNAITSAIRACDIALRVEI